MRAPGPPVMVRYPAAGLELKDATREEEDLKV